MPITKNLYLGLQSWIYGWSYNVGDRINYLVNAYECTVPGISSTSPGGTGSDIVGGTTLRWKWLSPVDFTKFSVFNSSFYDAGDHVILDVWNCGIIQAPASEPLFDIFGHVTSPAKTITVRARPGESFRDKLLASSTTPLAYNSSNGVSIEIPASGVTERNVIQVNEPYVTIEGFQFKDNNPASSSTFIQGYDSALGVTITGCIFDGYAQTAGAALLASVNSFELHNCLIIDRAGGVDTPIGFHGAQGSMINCGVVGSNASTGVGFLSVSAVIRNSWFFGHQLGFDGPSASVSALNCGFQQASFGASAIDAGGNIMGLTASNQFVNASSNWRLKEGSAFIDSGVTDPSSIPTSDAITRVLRAQGVAWDIGPDELIRFFPYLFGKRSQIPYRA